MWSTIVYVNTGNYWVVLQRRQITHLGFLRVWGLNWLWFYTCCCFMSVGETTVDTWKWFRWWSTLSKHSSSNRVMGPNTTASHGHLGLIEVWMQQEGLCTGSTFGVWLERESQEPHNLGQLPFCPAQLGEKKNKKNEHCLPPTCTCLVPCIS